MSLIKIIVTYRTGSDEFPLNTMLDDELRKLLESIGARSTGSGSGCGGRDLVFELERKSGED